MPKLTCAQLEIPPVFPPVFVKESMLGPMNPLFAIIYEDDDLLVINKPAGLVCRSRNQRRRPGCQKFGNGRRTGKNS